MGAWHDAAVPSDATLWTGAEVAEALEARWECDAGPSVRLTGVGGPRDFSPGDLVVTGGHPDEHPRLLARGAAALLVLHADADLARSYPVLRVDDLDAALRALAVAARARFRGKAAAITGTVGKTWTKVALRHTLRRQGPTYATQRNLNSLQGVMISLARTPRDARFAIFEVGMSMPGSVVPKAELVRPHVAAITAIAQGHLGRHGGDVLSIVATKGAIFETLAPGGVAVVPRDSEHHGRLRELAERAGAAKTISFGAGQGAFVRLIAADVSAEGSTVEAEVDGSPVRYRLVQAGRHLVSNSLAVLAVAWALGADWKQVADDLIHVPLAKRRGAPVKLDVPGGSVTILDDAHNANPASMRAAFEVLGLTEPGPGASRVAVLADMLGLGDQGPRLHAELAAPLLASGVDRVITLGEEIQHLRAKLPSAVLGPHCASLDDLRDELLASVRPGDIVLVKGSGSTGIDTMVPRLAARTRP